MTKDSEIVVYDAAPAIANAVYFAMGKRVRRLPIMPAKLLIG
jgi:CO/xanthine dehydrogenase Mo-binding subunit